MKVKGVFMNVYVWRHNRKFHSYSMIEEPCVHQDFYCDAVVIVIASTKEEAWEKLKERGDGWRVEDIKRLEPQIFAVDYSSVVFAEIRG